jgi:hypothetical protein
MWAFQTRLAMGNLSVIGKSWLILAYCEGQNKKRGPPVRHVVVVPFDEGWSVYEETVIDVLA